ncbi:BCCT family transporter [Pseudomonas oryzae]|uniref:Betaine/carnitine transporter, BCCT family n=1 Tax=Pseudomonas oryzae TaxID=1392877 RepID=A0A1H1USF8_9PSED|nr:BCCT family transporter [Pseudomonas oryzae]SDS75191.1 betaine/carnitine transporter, BCCT family [Pseudomonas oryzae]
MSSNNLTSTRKVIEPAIFWPSVAAILLTSIPLILFPEAGKAIVNDLFAWVTGSFGWLLLLTGITSFVFMLWLAYGPLGRIKLGSADEQPEFSKPAWLTMLFCAGIGISICNWAFVEPLYMLDGPPLGIAKGTTQAAEWAAMYPMFHWGVVPWAIYLLPALPIAYFLYVRKGKTLRLSDACRGVLGNRIDGWVGKLIDVIVMFSIIGAVGTSLGLSVPLVSTLFQEMFGLEDTFLLQMGILVLWTAMIAWSVWNGLSKGIQTLSNVNAVLALLMLALVLLVGPTAYLFKLWTNSMGLFADNFFRINTWTDPVAKGGFPESWTVFYWAWWVAYAPMMGLFVARISRGRTIRELVLNGVLWGSIGCWVFFAIWGGYAIHLELNEAAALREVLNSSGIPATVVAVLKTLPLSEVIIPLFTLLCFVFLATTVDSAAYTLASVCTRELSGYEEPARYNRVLWAVLLAFVGVGLLSVGGLKAVQISTLLVALPMLPVLLIMGMSLVRWAREDFGDSLAPSVVSLGEVGGVVQVVRQRTAPLVAPEPDAGLVVQPVPALR